MFNAVTKKIIIPASLLFLLASCGSTQERKNAENLLSEAMQAVEAGNSALAVQLLDSLDSAYPAETEVRRQALALRPQAMQTAVIAEIEQADSLLAVLKEAYTMLEPKMKKISSKDLLEPYYVAQEGYNPAFMSSTGIQARVDEIGQFILQSSVTTAPLKHVALKFEAGGDVFETPKVPCDGETNYRLDGQELITFDPAQSDSVGAFLLARRGTPVKAWFISENGRQTPLKLSSAQVAGILTAYEFSQSIVLSREAAVNREKLERKLQIARDQIARTAQ